MKARILDRLRCPACRSRLELHPFAEEWVTPRRGPSFVPAEEERAIQEGVLLCKPCRVWYPITNYVPVMLLFSTAFHGRFARMHEAQLRVFDGYGPVCGQPRAGEASIQETFTEEWDQLQQDEFSFAYTLEDLKALNRRVWLRWTQDNSTDIRSVLNVGIGLGRETEALQSVLSNSEVYGVDLNFALLQSGPAYKERSDLHFVIASLFAPPFAPDSFDLVYSQGVIHHTYSTLDAFRAISAFVRAGGFLFVWVYGLDDHLVLRGGVGFLNRWQWRVEWMLRPFVSRAPASLRNLFFGALTAVAHPLVRSRVIHRDRWKWKNTNHTLRDWLSPRYAHRHSYNELLEWYEQLGFEVVDVQSPAAYRELFGKRLWGVGITGRRDPS